MTGEMEERVAQFVSHYYDLINGNTSRVHFLYHKEAEFSWPAADGTTTQLKTCKCVERFFAKQSVYKFQVQNTFVQSSPSGFLIVVRGRTGGIGIAAPDSSFVQVFNLEECNGQLLVVNDILTIIPDSKSGSNDQESEMANVSNVATSAGTNPMIKTGKTAITDPSNAPIIASGTNPMIKTGKTAITDPSNAPIIASGKNLLQKAGKGRTPPKAIPANIAEPTVRKSSFGRELKLTQRLDADYELQYRQNDLPTLEKSGKKATVVIVYDDRMLKHVQPPCRIDQKCPEIPDRLVYIMNQFRKDGLNARCDIKDAEPASYTQLELVHEPDYVQFVAKLPVMSKDDEDKFVDTSVYFSEDEGTRVASLIAAGSVIKACDLVAQNEYKRAFAVVRPPGHHAKSSKADGYCLLNNAAVGAEHIRNKYSLKSLMVDIDLHHGNGTQSIFYKSNGVLFISIHSTEVDYPAGPENGLECTGEEAGEGFNINIPLPGNYGDGDMLYIWNHIVLPIAREFDPDMIIISAGYDAAKGDPMALCKLTPKGYGTLVSELGQVGTGRMVMVLEGGYNLKVTAQCASHCVRAMLGDLDVLRGERRIFPLDTTKKIVEKVKSSMSKYWEVFKDSVVRQEEGLARESP